MNINGVEYGEDRALAVQDRNLVTLLASGVATLPRTILLRASLVEPALVELTPAHNTGQPYTAVSGETVANPFNALVLNMGKYAQVLRTVVGGIVVQMVNKFVSPEKTTKLFLHNKTVFSNVPRVIRVGMRWHLDKNVTALVCHAATFPASILFHRASNLGLMFWRQLAAFVHVSFCKTLGATRSQFSGSQLEERDDRAAATGAWLSNDFTQGRFLSCPAV